MVFTLKSRIIMHISCIAQSVIYDVVHTYHKTILSLVYEISIMYLKHYVKYTTEKLLNWLKSQIVLVQYACVHILYYYLYLVLESAYFLKVVIF